jgi:hypothetical protein
LSELADSATSRLPWRIELLGYFTLTLVVLFLVALHFPALPSPHQALMSHSHSHGGHSVPCAHSHAVGDECAAPHAADTPAAVVAALVSGHSHAHAAVAPSSSSSAAAPLPCDYCSSIKAHSQAQKRAQREEQRQQRQAADLTADAEEEEEEEELDDDEQAKLILPGQRISLPLMSPWVRQAVWGAFALVALKVVRDIIVARR